MTPGMVLSTTCPGCLSEYKCELGGDPCDIAGDFAVHCTGCGYWMFEAVYTLHSVLIVWTPKRLDHCLGDPF